MNALPTIVADDVPGFVARLKQEPGKDIALIGSSHLAATPAAHGLIDEYRFFVVPVLSAGASVFSTACRNGSR
jgi:dihydrofolate reductase